MAIKSIARQNSSVENFPEYPKLAVRIDGVQPDQLEDDQTRAYAVLHAVERFKNAKGDAIKKLKWAQNLLQSVTQDLDDEIANREYRDLMQAVKRAKGNPQAIRAMKAAMKA